MRGEQQQAQTEDVPNVEAPRRSQKVRKSAIPADYEVYNTEEFQMEDDPTSFEEAMRSDHSSKWLEAMEDEMKTMNENEEPVIQDPIESIATHEGEQQQPQTEDVPNMEAPKRSQRVRKSDIPADHEVYNTKEFQMEDYQSLI